MLNYDHISTIYDAVRQADVDLVAHLIREGGLSNTSVVLDIGCGTGNYADQLQRATAAQVYGLDASAGMLDKARQKNPHLILQLGDAEQLSFEADTFDFVYMTDVIHHIPHIDALFAGISRVLKSGGKVCIVTQSHDQIENRPITRFFPATAEIDKARYPDIPAIIAAAVGQRLSFITAETVNVGQPIVLGQSFLNLVKTKGYSMLSLMTDADYSAGLKQLKDQLQRGEIAAHQAGDTLVWFQKE